MKHNVKLASARTPDGSEMVLYQHEQHFTIKLSGQDLMISRQHTSEEALASLGCFSLGKDDDAQVLIGGLGLGYTLRRTLDTLGPSASVMVGELMPEVVDWNRNWLGILNDHPLKDERVEVKTGDVVKLISNSKNRFNAILLDIDNGPSAMTDAANQFLYNQKGISDCRRALCNKGCLAIWSVDRNTHFEQRLKKCGFQVRCFKVPAYPGSKSQAQHYAGS